MRCIIHFLLPVVLALIPAHLLAKTVVFWQSGFPVADSPVPNEGALRAAFADAEFVDATHLSASLTAPETDLLVLPYGSAWPEEDWDGILEVSGSRREFDRAGRQGIYACGI